MSLPTSAGVLLRWRDTSGAPDAHGNDATVWGEEYIPLPIYAIAPRTSTEPVPGRDEVITGLTIYAPKPANFIGPGDRIIIGSEGEWEVDGEVGDYNRGPFGYAPGVVIHLRKAEG